MTEQTKALRLAHWLERGGANCQAHIDAAAELRRLHALNGELLGALRLVVHLNERDVPMTDEELRVCRAAIAKAEGGQT